jgi:hypothetical protein
MWSEMKFKIFEKHSSKLLSLLLVACLIGIGYFIGVITADSVKVDGLKFIDIENEYMRLYTFKNGDALFIQHPAAEVKKGDYDWIVDKNGKIACIQQDSWNYVLIYMDPEYLDQQIPKKEKSKGKQSYTY